ncbi:peptide-methionine (S)-S-oxide reductase MsrA [Lignipirellula cremea]|uniref:Peptide methionine sulfoxide reductase MsrA n=1 Tax=Lignipirellula cremea TaxID=2528010 RepID=A0A518E1E5_9BACT|nr:peptide-methionine (S)-S-oxide reductase MsrA [Lignipirellula cremea]QDU97910.1 Peptide methionine sulfoxide reductase MsrA [Lignipirellula cremea]
MDADPSVEVATFGAGCFWCVEAVFNELKGVRSVVSGYMGGPLKNPTYEQICTGQTGHAEVAQVTFDPEQIRFEELLEVFWKTHDPTTLNRQGNDKGTQYRSAVFYHSDQQRQLAETFKQKLRDAGVDVVTEITAADVFYPAEDYHQDFFAQNNGHPYCTFVVRPKVEKVREVFADKLRDEGRS